MSVIESDVVNPAGCLAVKRLTAEQLRIRRERNTCMRFLKILTFAAASAMMAVIAAGCTDLENGVYNNGVRSDYDTPNTLPDNGAVTDGPGGYSYRESDTLNDLITDDTPALTTPQQDADASGSSSASSTPPVSDVIEPLTQTGAWDYSTLNTECNGYGQGTHFDDLNRPRGAVRFNEDFGKFNAKAISDTEEKIITLTFDQGYENGYTSIILDTLKEKGVKATFFVVQDYAERQPELIQRMIDEGHTVGSHSWHHYSMPELSVEEAKEEIMELHEYMLTNFGICMNKFRPPKGEYSEQSLAVTGDLGYETVLWSFAYADWDTKKQPDPQSSLDKLIQRAHPGAIYLLHSVSSTNAEILGDFIDAMLEQGYTFG